MATQHLGILSPTASLLVTHSNYASPISSNTAFDPGLFACGALANSRCERKPASRQDTLESQDIKESLQGQEE